MSNFPDSEEEYLSGLDVSANLKNFHDALTALVPVFESAKIEWKDEDQFDDFEGIAESLYKWFVIYKAENIVSQLQHINFSVPNYGFFYKNYSKMSYIEVNTAKNMNSDLVFLFFKTKKKPFDTMYCNKINRAGIVEEEGIEIPYKDCIFMLKQRY